MILTFPQGIQAVKSGIVLGGSAFVRLPGCLNPPTCFSVFFGKHMICFSRIFLGKMVKHPSKSSPIQKRFHHLPPLPYQVGTPATWQHMPVVVDKAACRQTRPCFLPVFGAGKMAQSRVIFFSWMVSTCFRRMLFIFCYG